jgi:hypothetical protein
MKIIKIEGKEYRIPTKLSDITVEDYEQWFDYVPHTERDKVELVSKITKIPLDILLNIPTDSFYYIVGKVSFIFSLDLSSYTSSNVIDIEGTRYVINTEDKITLGEYVDAQGVLEQDKDRLSELLSIVCRPLNERYDSGNNKERIEIFKSITLDRVFPLFAFFLQYRKRYTAISSSCSKAREMADRLANVIRTSAEDTDGQRQSMSFPMKIFYRWKMWKISRQLRSLTTSVI